MNIKFSSLAIRLALLVAVWIPAQDVSATHLPGVVSDPAGCTAVKGMCLVGPQGQPIKNCQLTTQWYEGVCNATTEQACCVDKVVTSGVGSDEYCINTLKGNCRSMSSGGCFKVTEANVGACSLIPGIPPKTRVCCKPVVPAAAIGGPAISTYQLLEKIPGSNKTDGKLNTYLEDIYRFAFWAVGIAVVFMLTIGGFMYLTSAGNTSRLGTAKTIIFDAFLGLILALVAWLFLNLINPDLVDLLLPVSTIATPTPTTEVPASTDVQMLANQILSGATGVSLAGGGDCKESVATPVSPQLTLTQAAAGNPVTVCQNGCPGNGFCTGSTQISARMLQSLISVSVQFPMTISSFTGGSHSTGGAHYQGRAADIIPSSPPAVWPEVIRALRNTTGGLLMCDKAGVKVDCSIATHIHAEW